MNNDATEEFLKQNPLAAFSWLTQVQVGTVNSLGGKLLRKLSAMLREEGNVDGHKFVEVYGLFWIWVISAYEITRTMSGAGLCFSTQAATQLLTLKRQLALLRIPFAKQELPGSGKHIRGETSVHNIDFRARDLQFRVKNSPISVRELILSFRRTMRNIKRSDVLHDIQYAHKSQAI